MIKNGFFPPFSLFGVPVLIHCSFPIGAFVIAALIGDFQFGKIVAAVYSYTLLIIIHELGHAAAAWNAGSRIHKISLDAFGGWCYADEPQSFLHTLLFYCGGLLAQLLLLVVVLLCLWLLGNPSTNGLNTVVYVFTFFNIVLLIGNLIPYSNNDGHKILNLVRGKD